MGEVNKNLWAPWRLEYVQSLAGAEEGCFLCRYARTPENDRVNLVIWRTDKCLTLFNRFPYANGHLLIAPVAHRPELHDLDEPMLDEFIRTIRDAQRLVREVTSSHGSNIGMNFGKCAGAGLPGHLHAHIVPRWDGDVNFMAVMTDTRIIPQSIESLRQTMASAVDCLGLPPVRE